MSDPFLAEIRIFACNYAPQGWALCNGQILSIAQNTALFSLLGVNYGGNGQTTFALPNLQGMVPIHAGQGPGLEPYNLGEAGGTANVTLQQTEMPAHAHQPACNTSNGTVLKSANNQLSRGFVGSGRGGTEIKMYSSGATNGTLAPQAILPAGGGQPHNNMMPYLTLNFCIALQGIFPQRP
jgi:microcystin-dependent protein